MRGPAFVCRKSSLVVRCKAFATLPYGESYGISCSGYETLERTRRGEGKLDAHIIANLVKGRVQVCLLRIRLVGDARCRILFLVRRPSFAEIDVPSVIVTD